MVDIPINELRAMSYAEIEGLVKRCQSELQRRDIEEREELITNFRKAYFALKDAGVTLRYCDEYENESTTLYDWECFYFD